MNSHLTACFGFDLLCAISAHLLLLFEVTTPPVDIKIFPMRLVAGHQNSTAAITEKRMQIKSLLMLLCPENVRFL